jgi:hypothetical protein
MPKWAYKRSRDESAQNKNPMLYRNGTAIQTSEQIAEQMLCDTCEQRLGRLDNWASRVLYQVDHSAPILARAIRDPAGWLDLSSDDAETLVQFCMSIFWRAHTSKHLGTSLGRYGDAVRNYLHDDVPLPHEVVLITSFYECSPGGGSQLDALVTLPTSQRNTGFHQHRFILFGLDATLVVGQQVSSLYRQYCLIRSPPRKMYLVHSDQVVKWVAQSFAEAILWRKKRGYDQ